MTVYKGTLRDQAIVLAGTLEKGVDGIAHANMERCEIRLASPCSNVIIGSALTDCTIIAEGAIKHQHLSNCRVSGCRFAGTFIEGKFIQYSQGIDGHIPWMQGCDFSGANLAWCYLNYCDIDSLILPSWPNFVLIPGRTTFKHWATVPFPSWCRGQIGLAEHVFNHPVPAFTFNWHHLAKYYGIPAAQRDEEGERLHEVLRKRDFIVC